MTEIAFLEPVAPSSEGEARARVRKIRDGFADVAGWVLTVTTAFALRDWEWLGYASWDAYTDAEYGDLREQLPPALRPQIVAAMRAENMDQRAIAAAVGVSQKTVSRDLIGSSHNDSTNRLTSMSGGRAYERQPPELRPPHRPEPPAWSEDERLLRLAVESGEAVVASLRGHHQNLITWADDAGLYVRIDRRTEWGNPFEIPDDGDRETVVASYRDHYLPHKPGLLSKLDGLRGKVLACWCAPEACHGDVLKARAGE